VRLLKSAIENKKIFVINFKYRQGFQIDQQIKSKINSNLLFVPGIEKQQEGHRPVLFTTIAYLVPSKI